jgi:hypothetical protein
MRIGFQDGVWTNVGSFVLTGAGAVTGATAEQPLLQYIGWAGMVFGLLLLLWGLKIDGRQWWRRREPSPPGSNWQALHLALRYIALESEWAYSVTPAPAGKMDKLLERTVSEHLARGEVKARGREMISDMPYRLTAASVSIPPDFWPTAFFQAFGEIVLTDDERGAASRNGSFLHVPKSAYREVVLDMADVKRVWPPAANGAKMKSPFHHALVNHWKGELLQNSAYANDHEMWIADGKR